jgi:hypothetical protein
MTISHAQLERLYGQDTWADLPELTDYKSLLIDAPLYAPYILTEHTFRPAIVSRI